MSKILGGTLHAVGRAQSGKMTDAEFVQVMAWHRMMTSSNGNIFRVTGHLWGESPVTGGFPLQRPVTPSFDVPFYLRLNKWLSKQPKRLLFETPSRSLLRH